MSADIPMWISQALCAEVGGDWWFPLKGSNDAAKARRICSLCEVSPQCLAYALDNQLVDGIYGGLTPRQRRNRVAA